MNKQELTDRTKYFAHRCVKLAIALPEDTLGRHLKGQLIRAATSVAANYRAANLAISSKSFVAKLSIVIEEADECIFWLEFIKDENIIKPELLESLLNESKELTAIFIASRKTIAIKNNNK